MLVLKNLSIGRASSGQQVKLVENINLELTKGVSLGLVGESGSGKSLTALAIMGLLPQQLSISSGEILFEDTNLLTLASKKRREMRGSRISMIFQEPMTALNPVMHCGKQITESLLLHQNINKKEARKECIELLRKVQLPRPEHIFNAYPHQISGGQKQRVMIAMALANKPDLLIADEPTTALDVTVQKEILQLLKQLQSETGMGLLFITHDLNVVAEVAEEVAVMYQGKIVEKGSVSKLFKHPEHPYTLALLSCRPPRDQRLKLLPTLDDFMNNSGETTFLPETISSEQREKQLAEVLSKPALLNVEHLSKSYPLSKTLMGKPKQILQAVDDVSFKIHPGETLGLVGESGCGKTTLGRSLLRLIEPDKGKIFFHESELLNLSRRAMTPLRKDLAIVFQDPYSSLNPRMSIGKAIMEPMQVHGLFKNPLERKKQTLALLIKVGLQESHFYRYPHEFSGGQRQRIVIARALALQPQFIVCDEAVSALDVSVQAMVLNLLNELKAEFGFTYIFISHDLSVVRFMSDRILVMKAGKIVEAGDADQIYFHPEHAYTQQLIAAIPQIQ